jgi:hypothetical protein
MNVLVLEAGSKEGEIDGGEGVAFTVEAHVMQHFLTLTAMPVYALNGESFWSWMDMLVGESAAFTL